MRVVYLRQEAHHRGYRIEGEKSGEGIILRVTPTQAGLPSLSCWRFRTIRAPWTKAVCDVARYIDQELADIGRHSQTEPSAAAKHLEAEDINGGRRALAIPERAKP